MSNIACGGWLVGFRGLKLRKLVTNDGVMCLLTLLWGLGGVSATATIAEFLEPFYGLY